MDKIYGSSGLLDSISNTNTDQILKQLNKLSHKISKPPPTERNINSTDNIQTQIQLPGPPPTKPQPQVYNVDKNNFRDLVQKLTGSTDHDRFSSPPPIPPPTKKTKKPSSRLQRIRPPPLPHIITNRTSSPLINNNNVVLPPYNPLPAVGEFLSNFILPPPSIPLSPPLPQFPTVYTPVESPITAYMRCFPDSVSTFDDYDPNSYRTGLAPLAPMISPTLNNINGHADLLSNQSFVPAPSVPSSPSMFIPPFSPLPFGSQSPGYTLQQLAFTDFPSYFT